MADQSYQPLTDHQPTQNADNADYKEFPLPPSPRLSDPPPDMVDVSLSSPSANTSPLNPYKHEIEMKIEEPPQTATSVTKSPLKDTIRRRRPNKRTRPFINMRLRNFEKLFDSEQIYFACVAPLCSDHIDVHCSDLEKLDIHYCCGLFMKVDRSFTVHTILSTEFITSLKKIILSKEEKAKAFVAAQSGQNEPSGPSGQSEQGATSKPDDSKDSEEDDPESKGVSRWEPEKFMAFHPRDHWEFAKDLEHKSAVIYVHGHNYAPNDSSAAEFVLNECLDFYADLPYLVIPFVWPAESHLVDYDSTGIIAEDYIASELATFIRRLWTLFERLDFVGHGKGCNILLRAMKLLKRDKPDVIDMSHVVLIAADMDAIVFYENYVNDIYRFVKRITVYVNTWDWKLFAAKYWNWSAQRVGAMIMGGHGKYDCIDVTQLVSSWFGSNHYYLKNRFFKMDLIQALSKVGGVDPRYRNYVLPVYQDVSAHSGALLDKRLWYHELVDKPYMKVVPEKKENANKTKEEMLLEAKEEEENREAVEQKRMEEFERNMKIIRNNLKSMGYVGESDSEDEVELESIEVR